MTLMEPLPIEESSALPPMAARRRDADRPLPILCYETTLDRWLWLLVALMVIGLGLESVADRQKYRFKAAHPTRFCDTGLYHFVRCPNYLGEMLFWIGLWLSATAAYQGWLEWSLCSLGLATILGIMIGATRRLEGEQATHYGNDGGYATYRTSVPVRGSGSGRP